MTSRERVQAALNHKEPDRVPIDCGGTICSALTRTAHNTVKEALRIDTEQEPITNPILDTVVPCEQLLDRWQVDFRRVSLRPPSSIDVTDASKQSFVATEAAIDEKPRGFEFTDEFGTAWKKADFDYCPTRYGMEEFDLADLKKFKWPDYTDPGIVVGLEEDAKALYENTDFCIVADIPRGGPFEQGCWSRNYATFLMDFYENPTFVHTLLDGITDNLIGYWGAYLDSVGKYVQVVAQGDDMGTQTGEYISPKLYREFIFPRQKRLFDFIHSKTDAKIFLHSCGSIRDIIPDLIEAGVDALNPVQYAARNMDLAELKKEFGSDLAFWGGGISTQNELEEGYSPDMIGDIVKRNMDIMMPDGGFVFAATHNIQHECPPEKTIKIYDTAVSYRKYQ